MDVRAPRAGAHPPYPGLFNVMDAQFPGRIIPDQQEGLRNVRRSREAGLEMDDFEGQRPSP